MHRAGRWEVTFSKAARISAGFMDVKSFGMVRASQQCKTGACERHLVTAAGQGVLQLSGFALARIRSAQGRWNTSGVTSRSWLGRLSGGR